MSVHTPEDVVCLKPKRNLASSKTSEITSGPHNYPITNCDLANLQFPRL